jgi:hypothetical protein
MRDSIGTKGYCYCYWLFFSSDAARFFTYLKVVVAGVFKMGVIYSSIVCRDER